MTSFLFLVVIVSSSWLGSAASDECTGGDRSSVLVVPSSGPIVCFPFDDYIQLQNGKASDGESTDDPPRTSVSSTKNVSSSALLLYRYMSPLWLQTHANFTETPSSVSAQSIEFATTSGSSSWGMLFKVQLIEAGFLNDDQAYSIQIAFFFTDTSGSHSILHICDGNDCVGFSYWYSSRSAYVFGGTDLVGQCSGSYGTSVTVGESSTTNWNIRLEIHPNFTSGITYVSTTSLTHAFTQKLKPSRGLQFKVCRDTSNGHQFHLFELAVHLNK